MNIFYILQTMLLCINCIIFIYILYLYIRNIIKHTFNNIYVKIIILTIIIAILCIIGTLGLALIFEKMFIRYIIFIVLNSIAILFYKYKKYLFTVNSILTIILLYLIYRYTIFIAMYFLLDF